MFAPQDGRLFPENIQRSFCGATKRQQAKAAVEKGETAYKLGRFEEALEEYSHAYELFPAPALLFNLGQCHKQLKNYERAIFFFEGYLRDEQRPTNRRLAEDLIAESRAEINAARLLVLQAAWKIDHEGGYAAREEISIIKFYAAGGGELLTLEDLNAAGEPQTRVELISVTTAAAVPLPPAAWVALTAGCVLLLPRTLSRLLRRFPA